MELFSTKGHVAVVYNISKSLIEFINSTHFCFDTFSYEIEYDLHISMP